MRIDEMQAGKEMDTKIQKHVFNQEPEKACFVDYCYQGDCVGFDNAVDCLIAEQRMTKGMEIPGDCEFWKSIEPPPCSTHLATAMEALEYVRQNARIDDYTVKYIRLEWYGGKWCCRIHFTANDDEIVWGIDESLPLAICRAALWAMGVTEI